MDLISPLRWEFPISRDPPEGGTALDQPRICGKPKKFPISRDPPEGGTIRGQLDIRLSRAVSFPISRDPPEGGT